MKSRDIVYCKKSVPACDLNLSAYSDEERYFQKDRRYYIGIVSSTGIYVSISSKYMKGRWFNLKCSDSYRYGFEEYFMTQKQLRKRKLEKLMNGR